MAVFYFILIKVKCCFFTFNASSLPMFIYPGSRGFSFFSDETLIGKKRKTSGTRVMYIHPLLSFRTEVHFYHSVRTDIYIISTIN